MCLCVSIYIYIYIYIYIRVCVSMCVCVWCGCECACASMFKNVELNKMFNNGKILILFRYVKTFTKTYNPNKSA